MPAYMWLPSVKATTHQSLQLHYSCDISCCTINAFVIFVPNNWVINQGITTVIII